MADSRPKKSSHSAINRIPDDDERPEATDESLERHAIPAVIYAAKSTEDRKGSIDTQLEDCRALATQAGAHVIGEYKDDGFSAYKGNRGPDLERAKSRAAEAANSASAALLVVQHSDRLARGPGDGPGAADHLIEVIIWARRNGVRLVSAQDPQSFENIALGVMMGERNHEDSKRKAAAVKAGKRRQFERGEWGGGPAPDGYVVEREFRDGGEPTRRLVIDEDRAQIIRMAFQLGEQGHGDPTIAKRLNAAGYRTQARRPFSRRRVQDMLTNPVYAGAVALHRGAGQEANWKADHPALVDRELFQRVASQRKDRDKAATGRPKGGRPTFKSLLAKLAECGRCGERMYAKASPYRRKNGTQARRYVCANVHHQTGLCDAPPIDADLADLMIGDHLHHLILDFEQFRVAALSDARQRTASLERQIEGALGELDEIELREGKMEADYERRVVQDNMVAADLAARRIESLRYRRETTHRDLAHLREQLANVSSESADDAALDAYNERRPDFERIRDALQGTESDGGFVEKANEELRAVFKAFRLDSWLDAHITVDPIYRERPNRTDIAVREDASGNAHYEGRLTEADPAETGNCSQGYHPLPSMA
jgi:DNA invertase Pin-like site-specific DNA recombinase